MTGMKRQNSKKNSRITKLTEEEVIALAVKSIELTDGLDFFWKRFYNLWKSYPTLAETREILAKHNDIIFRRGRHITAANSLEADFTEYCHFSGEKEGSAIGGFQFSIIDIKSLSDEIPNYGKLIQGKRRDHPVSVSLIEYQQLVRDGGVIQPVFKVVAEFKALRFNERQLFIVGRDRHTHDPFALAVPNGFINQSIDVCLRWTMDVHKGDEVIEI
jgi:hypothetical protein